MADLNIYYKGDKIFSASSDVLENIKTAGKYCEDDIVVEYTKPTLPPLTNPATDTEVVNGYEYYDDQGVAQIGSYVPLDTSDATATASDILDGETAYVNGVKVTGTYVAPYDWASVAKGFSVSSNASFTSNNLILSIPYVTGAINGLFQEVNFAENTELTISAPNASSNVGGLLTKQSGTNNLKILHLNINWTNFTTGASMFSGCRDLVTLDSDIDLSNFASGVSYMFRYCTALENVRFVPNTIVAIMSSQFNACSALSNASLVSIANGLKDGVTSETLTLHATPKARTLEILGTVSQITDENQVTYNFFTADPEGQTSLNSFITNIKGWTLA